MAEELHFDDPAAAAQDPSTDAEALRQLAYRYPELRPAVAAHPHAYRGLLDWLHQFNDPQVNAALEARDDYDGYIDSNGYLVMHGDVSGAVAGSSIRTSESGMYVLGQGGVNSYSQVERTTPYSAVVGTNAPVPQVGAREQVVAQVQRQSIMGSKGAQDPEATAVYPSASFGSSYPSASGTPARPQSAPQAYPGAGASHQVQPTVSQEAAPKEEKERRGFPMMGVVLGILGLIAVILLGFVIYVFTRGYEGPATSSDATPSASSSSPAHATPSPSATTEEPVKYPAPAGAITVDSFSSPSGNITCSFTADGVSCGIKESDWAEDGYASCSGSQVGVLTASKDKAGQSCEAAVPGGGNALAYGAAQILVACARAAVQDKRNGYGGSEFAQAREVQLRRFVALVDAVRSADGHGERVDCRRLCECLRLLHRRIDALRGRSLDPLRDTAHMSNLRLDTDALRMRVGDHFLSQADVLVHLFH